MGEDNPQVHHYEHHLLASFGSGKDDGKPLDIADAPGLAG
jgi:ATP-dependent DNA helicase RecQ